MYKNSLKTHKTFKSRTEKTVIIGGGTDYCAERYGYKRETNGITPLPNFRRYARTIRYNGITNTEFLPPCHRVLFTTVSGNMYGWNSITRENPISMGAISPECYPRVHCYLDDETNFYAVVGGKKITTINVNSLIDNVNMPNAVTDSVLHCGRVFAIDATDSFMLRWSGYGLSDWTEGLDRAGHLRLKAGLGKLLNLFVLGEKIVIVRELGITVLSTLGDSRHMRPDISDKYRLPRVFANTSAICGGQLWIYTQKGMYAFDGSTATKMPFDEIMRGYTLEGPKTDDRYIHYNASKDGSRYLFIYDTQTGACSPYSKGCSHRFCIDDEEYCFNGTLLSELLPEVTDANRVWISKPFTFGEGEWRTLKSLKVAGSGQFKVEIDCDGRKLYVNDVGKFNYAESGQRFIFKVTGDCAITELTSEWEVRG